MARQKANQREARQEAQEAQKETPAERPSLAAVLTALANDTLTLIRQQLALAKAEAGEKAQQVSNGIKLQVAGGVVLLVALVYLLDALVYGIARLFPVGYQLWLGALVVGIAAFIAGLVLLKKGGSQILTSKPLPTRTLASIKRDARIVRGGAQ